MCSIALLCLVSGAAWGQQQFVYPAKGQTPAQQKSDESACYSWAVQQTGFDPAKPNPVAVAPAQPTTATGTRPGAGVGGAMKGAVIGGIAGDAGAGAAAGAVAARSQSRRQNASAAQASQQQAAATSQQQQAGFAKARAACLEGRGYTIK